MVSSVKNRRIPQNKIARPALLPVSRLERQRKCHNRKIRRLALKELKGEIRRMVRKIKRTKALNPEIPEEVEFDPYDVMASVCRESFFEFVKEFWSCVSQEKPIWNWHIEYLCHRVQLMMERVFKGEPKKFDLVVNIPPGTTKSTIMSVMLPAWAWTRMPRFKFIGASYSEKLARDDLSLKTRDIVESDKYKRCFTDIVLREDQNTKGLFQNTHGGWRYAVGVNGSVTGKHAHCIVIDDPLDPNQAFSELDLNAANRWIRETLSSRKVDKAVTVTILVMQRLHQDDPTAQMLTKRNVKHIKLPAELEDRPFPKRIRKFYRWGLLDPVRLSKKVLKEYKGNGAGFYASQFRQSPAPPEGAMFKTSRLKYGPPPTRWQRLVRFWDKAGTADGGNWTVGTLMGLDLEGKFWILDVIRFKKDSAERERIIERTARQDGYAVQVGIEQEGGSGGKESAENTVRRLAGFRVTVIKVNKAMGDKKERADPFSSQVNAGNVYLPETTRKGKFWVDWAYDWVEEVKYFPHSKDKDQVDSAALAFSMCHRKKVRVGGFNPSTEEQLYEARNSYGQVGGVLLRQGSGAVHSNFGYASKI